MKTLFLLLLLMPGRPLPVDQIGLFQIGLFQTEAECVRVAEWVAAHGRFVSALCVRVADVR